MPRLIAKRKCIATSDGDYSAPANGRCRVESESGYAAGAAKPLSLKANLTSKKQPVELEWGNLFCTETMGAANEFSISTNSAFLPTTVSEDQNKGTCEKTTVAPVTSLPSPKYAETKSVAEKQLQRVASLRAVIKRSRRQHARGDFAQNAEEALRNLNPAWRSCLVEWLQMITIKKSFLHSNTAACAVSLLDSFISKCDHGDLPKHTSTYQLYAVAAFTLASKICERNAVSRRTVHDLAQGRFTAAEIAAMELKMTNVLDWHICPITIHDITTTLLEEAVWQLSRGQPIDSTSPEGRPVPTMEAKRLTGIASVFLDLQLSTTRDLQFPRSAVALGTLKAACQMCNVNLRTTLSHMLSEDIFNSSELALVDGVSRRCKSAFFESFPDLRVRAPSPKSVMDIAAPDDTFSKVVQKGPSAPLLDINESLQTPPPQKMFSRHEHSTSSQCPVH